MGFRLKILALLPLLLWGRLAFAGVEQISEKEFTDLAQELSGKVNLFQEGWKNNPDAEFYGGTTRDYLYWLKGQFISAHDRSSAERVIAKLKSHPIIDVREFIIGDSDVDVISAEKGSLNADQFGVRKIDFQPRDILDPSTELGQNEILQGYIPAEKIRLAKDGFHATELGDGVSEIYHGNLSVHFASAEDFAKSKYAKEGINHPILLALRYIRLQAINYYRTNGKGFPDKVKLHAGMEEASARQAKEIVNHAIVHNELEPYLKKDKFKSWINGAVQKSFRSYTNPTAALVLMKEFGVQDLHSRYPKEIETLNQYVFEKYRDPALLQKAFQEYEVNESAFFTPPENFFADGKLYHGTKSEHAFRGILFQGVLPSDSAGRNAGAGLYGVAQTEKKFSEDWAGDKNRLLSFDVKPGARIVDITTGEGKRVWDAAHMNYEDFAEHFGVDIFRYPYTPQAFVVKNAAVLTGAQGVYRSVKPLTELLEDAKTSSLEQILHMFSVNSLSAAEKSAVWQASTVKKEEVLAYLQAATHNTDALSDLLSSPYWLDQLEIDDLLEKWVKGGTMGGLFGNAWEILLSSPRPSQKRLEVIDRLMGHTQTQLARTQPAKVFDYLLAHASPMPISTENAVRSVELAIPHAFISSSVIAYLQAAPLSDDQVNRLRRVYDICGDADHLLGEQAKLGSVLIRQPALRDEIKKYFIVMLERSALDHKTKWPFAETLLREFPADPVVAAAALKYFHANYEKSLDAAVAAKLQHIPEVRKKMLTDLGSAVLKHRDALIQALSGFKFNDEELAQFIDTVPFNHYDLSRKIQAQTIARHENTVGPKSVKAMIRSYNEPADIGPEANAVLLKGIKNYPDKAVLQSYIAEEFARMKNLSFAELDTAYAHGLFRLITDGTIPLNLDMQHAALDLLEKFPDHSSGLYLEIKQLRAFTLEDPAIATKVKDTILRFQLGYVFMHPDDLTAVLERLPPSPKVNAFLLDKLTTNRMETHLKLQPLVQLLRAPATQIPQLEGCAPQFAALGGDP